MDLVYFFSHAVSVATLFSACIERIENLELVQLSPAEALEYRLLLKVEVQNCLLLRWTDTAGLCEVDFRKRSLHLDDDFLRPIIDRFLLDIADLFKDGRDVHSRYGLHRIETSTSSTSSKYSITIALKRLPQFKKQCETFRVAMKAEPEGFIPKGRRGIHDTKRFFVLMDKLRAHDNKLKNGIQWTYEDSVKCVEVFKAGPDCSGVLVGENRCEKHSSWLESIKYAAIPQVSFKAPSGDEYYKLDDSRSPMRSFPRQPVPEKPERYTGPPSAEPKVDNSVLAEFDALFANMTSPAPRAVNGTWTHRPLRSVFECAVCFDSLPTSSFPSQPISPNCDHTSLADPMTSICLSCLQQALGSQLDGTGPEGLKCPLCHACLNYPEIRRWTTPETFERFDGLIGRAAAQSDPNFVWCSAGCGMGQIHVGGSNAPIVHCIKCGVLTCFNHQNARWHEGLTCHEFENPRAAEEWLRRDAAAQEEIAQKDRRRQAKQEEARKTYEREIRAVRDREKERAKRRAEEMKGELEVRNSSKQCPGRGCSYRITRTDGCKHMTCTKPFSFPALPFVVCYLYRCMLPARTGPFWLLNDGVVERHGSSTDHEILGSRCRQQWCYICGQVWKKGHLDVYCG
jgi:hypothetical protein